jgi:anti-sigma B factor antagonist
VPQLRVETHTDGPALRVAIAGELDLAAIPAFEEELRRVEADRPDVLVLDMTLLTFMDSSGLRALVMADDRARTQGRRLAIVPGPPQVRRVFEITKLDERLDLVDDPSAV